MASNTVWTPEDGWHDGPEVEREELVARFTRRTPTPRDRAVRLMPWATSGWEGYTRSVRDSLQDASDAYKRHDRTGGDYWLEQAELCAERHAPKLEQKMTYREPLSQEIREGRQTYGDRWKELSIVGFSMTWFPDDQ